MRNQNERMLIHHLTCHFITKSFHKFHNLNRLKLEKQTVTDLALALYAEESTINESHA